MKRDKENEVVAAIAAAITAYYADSECKQVIRSIRRVPQTSPTWNVAGRVELIKNKLN